MRQPNFLSTVSNRASLSITQTLYDRRALDCTSIKPLIQSLQRLMVLTSSSSRVRETLCLDGGLERLIQIMKDDNDLDDALVPYKWHLCMQCLLNLGARGSEHVRMRVLEAGAIPVIATVLDNYLVAHGDSLEHRDRDREGRDSQVRRRLKSSAISRSSRSQSTSAPSLVTAVSEQSTMPSIYMDANAPDPFPPAPAGRPASRMSSIDSSTESAAERAARLSNDTLGNDESARASTVEFATSSLAANPEPRVVSHAEQFLNQFSQATGQRMHNNRAPHDFDEETTDGADMANEDRLNLTSSLTDRGLGLVFEVTQEGTGPVTAGANEGAANDVGFNAAVDPTVATNGTGAPDAARNGPGMLNNPNNIMEVEQGGMAHFVNGLLIPREQDVFWALEIIAFVSKYSHLRREMQDAHFLPQLSLRSQEDLFGNSSCNETSVSGEDEMDDDVDTSGHSKKACCSGLKGCHMTSQQSDVRVQSHEAEEDNEMQIDSDIAPESTSGISMAAQHQLAASAAGLRLACVSHNNNTHKHHPKEINFDTAKYDPQSLVLYYTVHDDKPVSSPESLKLSLPPSFDAVERSYYTYDFENGFDVDEEYLTRTINLFELVERFTAFRAPREFPHWACIIMRNFVRKDEGGIRQCANFACGKWEEYPRQFAKCRRCKRTKYCSKACQLKAWSMHRYWCAPSSSSSQSQQSSISTSTQSYNIQAGNQAHSATNDNQLMADQGDMSRSAHQSQLQARRNPSGQPALPLPVGQSAQANSLQFFTAETLPTRSATSDHDQSVLSEQEAPEGEELNSHVNLDSDLESRLDSPQPSSVTFANHS